MNTKQQDMWAPPTAAAIGELLERLGAWCDQHPACTFALRRSVMTRLRRGTAKRETERGWVIEVWKRNVRTQSITADTLVELAKLGSVWLDEQRGGA